MNGLMLRQLELSLIGAGETPMDPQAIDQFGRNWGLAGILCAALGLTLWRFGGWLSPLAQSLILAREEQFKADAKLAEIATLELKSLSEWRAMVMDKLDKMERAHGEMARVIFRRCGSLERSEDQ